MQIVLYIVCILAAALLGVNFFFFESEKVDVLTRKSLLVIRTILIIFLVWWSLFFLIGIIRLLFNPGNSNIPLLLAIYFAISVPVFKFILKIKKITSAPDLEDDDISIADDAILPDHTDNTVETITQNDMEK